MLTDSCRPVVLETVGTCTNPSSVVHCTFARDSRKLRTHEDDVCSFMLCSSPFAPCRQRSCDLDCLLCSRGEEKAIRVFTLAGRHQNF